VNVLLDFLGFLVTIPYVGASIRVMTFGLHVNNQHDVIIENVAFSNGNPSPIDRAVEVRNNSYKV
jgi:hypothetical protein